MKIHPLLFIPLPSTNGVNEASSSYQIHQHPLTFDLLPDGDELDHHWTAADPQADFLRWHHHLGLISFKTLHALAKLGKIPKTLAKVPLPTCAGCILHVWGHKQEAMADQRRNQPYLETYQTQWTCLCRPTYLQPTWLHGSSQRKAHQPAFQRGKSGQILQTPLSTDPTKQNPEINLWWST